MNDDERRLISSLEAQEERLVFTRFDDADAWRLGSAMVAAATERSLPVTIDIRRHGQQLFHAARPGTTAENDAWIERKVNVVNRFAAASYLVGRRLAATSTALDEALGVRAAAVRGARGRLPDPHPRGRRGGQRRRLRIAPGRGPRLRHRDDRSIPRRVRTISLTNEHPVNAALVRASKLTTTTPTTAAVAQRSPASTVVTSRRPLRPLPLGPRGSTLGEAPALRTIRQRQLA
jgi:uncharacterized protein (UPF0303 family)